MKGLYEFEKDGMKIGIAVAHVAAVSFYRFCIEVMLASGEKCKIEFRRGSAEGARLWAELTAAIEEYYHR